MIELLMALGLLALEATIIYAILILIALLLGVGQDEDDEN